MRNVENANFPFPVEKLKLQKIINNRVEKVYDNSIVEPASKCVEERQKVFT